MKIAVTGASGHIGSNLCPELHRSGYEIRLLKFQDEVFRGEGIEVVEGSLEDQASLEKLIDGMEVVVHLAGKISIGGIGREEVFRINRDGTRNVVEACLEKGVRRLIHFSTIHAYNPFPLDEVLDETRELVGSGGTDYDLSKVAGEQYVNESVSRGLEVIIITPTSVFGPNDNKPSLLGNAIIDMYNGKIPTLVPGGYDFTFVKDLVRGVIAALDGGRNGEKYLMSGHYLPIKELAKTISDIGNVPVTQKVLSSTLLKMLMPFFQLHSKIVGKPPIFTRESLKALIESNRKISSAKATRDFGYQITPIDQAMSETLSWYRSNGYLKR